MTNSETPKNFLDTIKVDIGKAAMMDNTSYHKSEKTDEYLNNSDGMFEYIFLPAYTPKFMGGTDHCDILVIKQLGFSTTNYVMVVVGLLFRISRVL